MNKKQTQRRQNGPTLNGGAYSIIFFTDDDDQPIAESDSTKARIIEYDQDNNVVHRTYMEKGDRNNVLSALEI